MAFRSRRPALRRAESNVAGQRRGRGEEPRDIDERSTRRAVAAIAIRRHAGMAAYQKSRDR